MHLLIVDDDKLYLDSWVELLRGRGHRVHPHPDLQRLQEKRLVQSKRIDLALIDGCLSVDDMKNRDGIEFAVRLHMAGIPAILVTAYCPTETEMFEYLRNNALAGIICKEATDGDERAGLIDFYSHHRRCPNGIAQFKLQQKPPKCELVGPPVWNGLLSLLGRKRTKIISATDIAVLFRGLVSPCVTRITMREIAKGKSGAALVRARVSFGDGPVEDDVAIKFGNLSAIRSEAMRYDRFCGPLPDGAVAQLRWRVETEKLGAIAYSWVGDSINDGKPLGSKDISWTSRRETIKHLFTTSLNPWFEIYRNTSAAFDKPQSLIGYYTSKGGLWYDEAPDLNALGLPKAAGELSLPVLAENGQWNFGAFGMLSDPVRWLSEGEGQRMTFSQLAPSHGDLHARNVFVLAGDAPRLIDFGRTALGHVYRDFAALEVSLRLTCVDPQTPHIAKQIEDCLCEATTLGQALDFHRFSGNYHVKELIETIKDIRRAAADCCGAKEPPDAMAQYYYAVLMHMVRYATGIADEVSDDSSERRQLRLWHAHYAAAKIKTVLENL